MNRSPLALLALALALSGCAAEVQHGLNEQEANEIVVVLERSGIAADKVREEGGEKLSFAVAVPKGEKARAMEILVANRLPRPRPNGITEIFKGEGMIPTQTEEAMRKLAATQNEIARNLSAVEGVLSASVNLSIPERSELDEKAKAPQTTASVLVSYRVPKGADAKPPVTVQQIQTFVSRAVQELAPENVAVILTPSALPGGSEAGEQFVDVLGLRMSADSVGTFKAMAAVMILAIVGLSLWIGLLYYNKSAAPARPGRARPGPAPEA